jgi:hypothetical protein
VQALIVSVVLPFGCDALQENHQWHGCRCEFTLPPAPLKHSLQSDAIVTHHLSDNLMLTKSANLQRLCSTDLALFLLSS